MSSRANRCRCCSDRFVGYLKPDVIAEPLITAVCLELLNFACYGFKTSDCTGHVGDNRMCATCEFFQVITLPHFQP